MIEEIKRFLPKRPKDPPNIVVKFSLLQKNPDSSCIRNEKVMDIPVI